MQASRHETCLIELDSLVAAQSGLISNFPGRVGGLKGKLLVSHVHCHKKVKSMTQASSSRLFFLPSFKLPARRSFRARPPAEMSFFKFEAAEPPFIRPSVLHAIPSSVRSPIRSSVCLPESSWMFMMQHFAALGRSLSCDENENENHFRFRFVNLSVLIEH
jgi:hypothetical protein